MQMKIEWVRGTDVWVYRALSFVGVPAIILLLGFLLGAVIFWVWLILLTSYIVLLSVLGITNQPTASSGRRIRRVVKLLGSLVWGGFFLLLYECLYVIIFHYGDLAAH